MRVIAGKYRSRPLRSLLGMDLRPTADKLRQSLFNILTPGDPDALAGTIWIDFFAGTGAVGIEALSRGASQVYFVESDRPTAELIKQNLKSLKIETGFRILQQNVSSAISVLGRQIDGADFIFLDPPYRMESSYAATLSSLANSSLLKATTIVMAEHFKKFDPAVSFGELQKYRTMRQGDASISFYRRTASATSEVHPSGA
jgi:16S rRNA (guanine966-N2)-methyltransferase